MLAPEHIAEAASLLLQARRTGVPLRELPVHCKPASAADSNAIIDAVSRGIDEPVSGWKIAFIYMPRQGPFICPLYRSRVFDSPAQVPGSITASTMVEPEISFRLTRDLPPRGRKYTPEEVADAVIACPSIEIVDSRFDPRHRTLRQMCDEPRTKLEAFADHVTTGAYVVGEGRTDWREFDLDELRAVLRTPDRVMVDTRGGHAFVDPFLPCVVLANIMRRRAGLRAGELLVTGSYSGFFIVEPGVEVIAEFENFGSARVAPAVA